MATKIDKIIVNGNEYELSGSGSASVSLTGHPTVTVGQLNKNYSFDNKSVEDILRDMLQGYVAPSGLSITLNLSSPQELGNNVTINKVTPKFNLGSKPLTSVEIRQTDAQGKVLYSGTTAASNSGISLGNNSVSANSNSTIWIKISDGTTELTATTTLSFVHPYYYGMANSTTMSETVVKSLTKKVENKGNKTYSFTGTDQIPVFAYPKGYGQLTLINDHSGNNSTGDFIREELTIDGTNYYVYHFTDQTSISGFNFTFIY